MKTSSDMLRVLKGEKPFPPCCYPLVPLGWAYGAAMSARSWMYGASVLERKNLPCRVISIGNITAGGTGKTPMTVYTARILKDLGHRPAVLIRGYGGGSEGNTLVVSDGGGCVVGPEKAGDEACMLAGMLGGVPVVMGTDRHEAGMLAFERFNADVALLDDGFQHMGLKRDLDVVLLDAAHPFGNGRVIPAGYLREPMSAIRRAGAAVLTRSDLAGADSVLESRRLIKEISPGLSVFEAAHVPAYIRSLTDNEIYPVEHVAGMDVYGFCGLADPASFTLILKQLSANITGFSSFADHHGYTPGDISGLESAAAKAGAVALITTEKDAVKLRRLALPGMRLLVLGVEMAFRQGEDEFRELVSRTAG